ncbi:DUF2934 domain-containing protein [Methylobacterium sp. J-068]|uniref:DUF2934 domain-containing protein n=1 Tax=Methylobacterium sp. J-068 TaxID=2836649 RepID=UPI001FBBEC05|nr:DUF2934 domain-containing protein [Methylobacterium sp. J-068]MCJ2035321.1 DUF2934 domain-containing protein [Methylobacterium sp. J-068]
MTHFEHQVRERAYYIWEGEGRVFGRADEHWLRAETELHASLSPAPVLVEAVAPSLTRSANPAEILGESLKAKPSRARGVTAKVEAKVKAAARTTAEPAPKAAKSTATRTASTKTAATETAAPATKSAPAAKAAATAKPAASKTAVAKPVAAKTAVAKAPKAAARPRAAEAVATVH